MSGCSAGVRLAIHGFARGFAITGDSGSSFRHWHLVTDVAKRQVELTTEFRLAEVGATGTTKIVPRLQRKPRNHIYLCVGVLGGLGAGAGELCPQSFWQHKLALLYRSDAAKCLSMVIAGRIRR